VTEKYSAGRYLHRIRTRDAVPQGPQWEVLQTLLGYAFTIQQELQRVKQASADAVSTLSANLGQTPGLQRIAACAQNLTESSGAAIALGGADSMICVARSGATAPPIGAQFDSRSGLSGECIRTGESAICVNAAADPRVNYQACRAMNIASLLYLPLCSPQGKLIGMLGVFAAQPLHFSQRDLSCLRFVEGLVQEELNRNSAPDLPPQPKASVAAPATRSSVTPDDVAIRLLKEYEQQLLDKRKASLSEPKPVLPVSLPTAIPDQPIAKLLEGAAVEVPVLPEPIAPRPEPIHVGGVVDEAVEEIDLNFHIAQTDEEGSPRSRMPVIMAIVFSLIVAIVGWNYSKFSSKPARFTPAQQMRPAEEGAPAPITDPTAAPVLILTPELAISSSPTGATISIALPKKIQFQGFALKNPDRVFFDLQGVQLADTKGKSFDIDPGIVSRVRIAGDAGTSRIVFDLRQPVTFEAKQTETPQRLIIELHTVAKGELTSKPISALPDDGKLIVVIDPGHGGRDTGTASINGVFEKELTLDIGKRLRALLKERLGAEVVLTRSDDRFVSLNRRVETANNAHADFFISIHGNSSSYESVRGVETFYFPTTQAALASVGESSHPKPVSREDTDVARRFAADVQDALLHGLSDADNPVRDRGIKSASFVVLREVTMPAVLAEVTFLSSQRDAQQLKSSTYREKVAKALFNGIASQVSRDGHFVSIADLGNQHPAGAP
jgi:N-acetylmuramoyl-L-alanine amidase